MFGDLFTKQPFPLLAFYGGWYSCFLSQGEEAVLVYLRNEIIGAALGTTTLRSLGLTTGKGLFR